MFTQLGMQRLVAPAALTGAVMCSVLWSGLAEAASGAVSRADMGVGIPREILPWRRGIEARAERLLKSARDTLAAGDKLLGERKLQAILRQYPRTFAARDAEREIAGLREKRVARAEPLRLGAPKAISPRAQFAVPAAPVAGWQTTVRVAPGDLHEALIEAAGDRVFFDEGNARLNKHALGVLRKQARWLKSHRGVVVRIAGHADDPGSTQANMRLAHDRAIAVQKRLMQFGVPPRRLRVFSFGNTKPIAVCSVRTCAIQNRRAVTEIRSVKRVGSFAQ